MWPGTDLSTTSLCWSRQDDPFTAAELLRAPQAMPRPVKKLSLTCSEIPQLPVLTPKHLLPAFDLLTQVPTIPLFSTKNRSHRAEEREGERKEKSATLRNLITPGGRLEMGTSERAGCWNAILSPLMAFPLTLNWECTYTHILNLLVISENWS